MKQKNNPWIDWTPGPCPVIPGTVVSLEFHNGVITNPIVVTDSKALSWDYPRAVWNSKLKAKVAWTIKAYRIESLPVKGNKDGA